MSEFQPEKSPRWGVRSNEFSPSSDEISPPSSSENTVEAETIANVIYDVIQRRHRGEQVCNDDIMAAHPELMPALREELLGLDAVHRAIIMATNPAQRDSFDQDLPICSRAEAPPNGDGDENDRVKRLRIQGYILDHEINSGGQATVFKAIQERTGRTVAVKVFHGGPFVGSRGRKRFDRESDIMARLNHPFVVGIIDRGRTEDGSFFLVMDFIEGTNLDGCIRKLGKDTAAVVRVFIKIALAVEDAHQQGIVHRDLKPMNILVDCRGDPHILDFGMARLLDDFNEGVEGMDHAALTRTGQMLGSLPWSSPEQTAGNHDAVDARSDVYALSVMLFSAITGEFPYPVTCNPRAAVLHIANTPPAPLARLAQQHGMAIPKGLERVVQKALAKSPNDRHPSAAAFARDLDACLAGKPPSIPRRRSGVWWGILIFGLAAVLAVVLFEILWRSDPPSSLVNNLDMHFVRIARGSVTAEGWAGFSGTVKADGLESFSVDHDLYLSTKVITQNDYFRVTGKNPSASFYDLTSPVQNVTQAQAIEFCRVLSNRERRKYRLPTAEEWKYAYYGGQLQPLTPANLDHIAWYAGNSSFRPHPVGLKLPDRRGLYDMIGNVRQWCADPGQTDSSALVEGADYATPASECLQPAKLEKELPTSTAQTTIGFRVVCESPD
jgi:serine/threonine protein kinase